MHAARRSRGLAARARRASLTAPRSHVIVTDCYIQTQRFFSRSRVGAATRTHHSGASPGAGPQVWLTPVITQHNGLVVQIKRYSLSLPTHTSQPTYGRGALVPPVSAIDLGHSRLENIPRVGFQNLPFCVPSFHGGGFVDDRGKNRHRLCLGKGRRGRLRSLRRSLRRAASARALPAA